MKSRSAEGNDRDAGVVEQICGYLTSVPPKSFFLFAGAGSGKTRTLVEVLRRLTGVELHDSGSLLASKLHARGQAIRVITYTRNAVAVINGRLGENDLTAVSTIHAFCWELISGYDNDIREALLDMNARKLQEARDTAEERRRGPTDLDRRKIQELEEKEQALISTPRFLYNPDRNTYREGALQHSQVLSATEWLLKSRATLRRILSDRYPIILVDESQDTMKGMLSILMQIVEENPGGLSLGLIGDHRQRIYMDGHRDLPGLVPEEWHRPCLEMNHRSQQRIVKLINNIWEADVRGRTQPTTGVTQHARTEKTDGVVRIFVGDSSFEPEEKVRWEARCAERMAEVSQCIAWNTPNTGYHILALEHKLAAKRGGFLDVYNALSLIDKQSTQPQGSFSNTGPAAVQVLLRELPALAACIDNRKAIDEFSVMELLHQHDRLSNLPTSLTEQQARLSELHQAVEDFSKACSQTNSTVRDVLTPIVRSEIFEVGERLLSAFHDSEPPPPVPRRPSDESIEDRCRRGWHDLFNSRWSEVARYKKYLEGRSNLATHQVIKGSEFDHVMVVMDDMEAGGTQFSYDKVFGAKPLTSSDEKNIVENKETTVDRTLRLLYVTCSRARETLALVLWSSDPEISFHNITACGWFSEEEVERIPETFS